MAISERLKTYLSLLMIQSYGHNDLDRVALIFGLDPTRTTIKDRCTKYASEIPEDRFHELAQYVMNFETYTGWLGELVDMRKGFARALLMDGFKVEKEPNKGYYIVNHQVGITELQTQKQETKTLLLERGFKGVQIDLDSADAHYLKGEYTQCLTMARKALEDLFTSMSNATTQEERNKFLSTIPSKSARDLIKSIYGYSCKGHELEIPEYEAIYGYHLILSSIYFILILFKEE